MKTHAKIAVNDRGYCWIGSYNLLSGAPGSETTEIGVLIESVAFSKLLIDKLIEWDEANSILTDMKKAMELLTYHNYRIRKKRIFLKVFRSR